MVYRLIVYYCDADKPALVGFGDIAGWDVIHQAYPKQANARKVISAVKEAKIFWTDAEYQLWADTPVGANLLEPLSGHSEQRPVKLTVLQLPCLLHDSWLDRDFLEAWMALTTMRLNAPGLARNRYLHVHDMDNPHPMIHIAPFPFAFRLVDAHRKGLKELVQPFLDAVMTSGADCVAILARINDRLEPFVIHMTEKSIQHNPKAADSDHTAALRWCFNDHVTSDRSWQVCDIHAPVFDDDEHGISALASVESAFANHSNMLVPPWTHSASKMRQYLLSYVVGTYIQTQLQSPPVIEL